MGQIGAVAAINCDVGFEFRVFGPQALGELHVEQDAVLDEGVGGRGQRDGLSRGPRRIECGAGFGEIGNRDGLQPSLLMATAVSAMRLEKPHSLSYQESTRTNTPSITWVCGRSKVELAGLWLKSIETRGSL